MLLSFLLIIKYKSMKCYGSYCNVTLEEGVKMLPKTQTVLNKSVLLDKLETKIITEEDPLGIQSRCFLSLDVLIQKLPEINPGHFYNKKRLCRNCHLAYSIIDLQRSKS